jgi:hypothetical protein
MLILDSWTKQLFSKKNPARLHKTNSLKYPFYSPTSLTNAYMEVKNNNMSVRKAARQFSVPRQTLRNRAIGKMMLTVFLILILKMHNLKWVLMTKKHVYMDIIETNAGVI